MPVTLETRDAVAVIRFANGPVNALSIRNGFVAELRSALDRALADPDARTILFAGQGRMFCGGADISDFGSDARLDDVRDFIAVVEGADKPVVMAAHGSALGGGLELMLAAHHRWCGAGTTFALPEVTLGLLPGAGGTQRLPRLVGAGPALSIMTTGRPVSAREALELGLIDRILEGEVVAAAVAALRQDGTPPIRLTAMLPPPADRDEAVAEVRAGLRPDARDLARRRIADCVAALTEDFVAGLVVEAAAFEDLVASEASRGLRHAFLGERHVARVPDLPREVRARSFERVGIVGGGLMGTGIATAVLNAGLTVTLVEQRPEALATARSKIEASVRRDVDKGRIPARTGEERLGRLACAGTIDALADADLVIEAVFEDMAVKERVFAALDRAVRRGTILASNTSTLDLDRLAAATEYPSRVVGLHFFSPANVMRLLEVVRGRRTAPDVLATAIAFAKRLGKVGVVSGVCDGFIGNRMFEEYLRQVWFMLEEGAFPHEVDGALEDWGFAMGPCRTMDLAGQDIGWAIRRRRAVERPEQAYSAVIDRVCELGRFGQKTGKGLYAYPDGRTAERDPEVEALIEAHSREIGLERRRIPAAEVVERCLLALVNEGARIVDEGIALRPVDVDVVYMTGYGFPRERGGPLFTADAIGLDPVLARMRKLAAGRNGWAWTPAPLLGRLAGSGKTFSDMNGAG